MKPNFGVNPPLVLDVRSTSHTPQPSPRFLLEVQENVLSLHTQTVDLSLRYIGTADPDIQGKRSVWVVDRAPFLIAELRYSSAFGDLLAGTTNEIGHFSTRGEGLWQIAAGAKGFDLVLPPQGIGEEMEKYKCIEENNIIAFRFTPPSVFRVQAAYYRQRYAEPPWNLRRLLGYRGQRDPGMGLDRFDFELLYGLAGSLETRGLRLAEIAARLGAFPGRQPELPSRSATDLQNEFYRAHHRSWADWYRLLQTRLAILEPWRPGGGGARSFCRRS
jgi:hypothetical protein